MRSKISIVVLAILIGFSHKVSARIIIPPIQGPIIKKISVFVPELANLGGTDGKDREFVNVLRNDLLNAGFFDVHGGSDIGATDSNNINFQAYFDAGAEALIKGEYQSSGDRINIAIRLVEVVREKELLGRSYEADPGRVRDAAHRFANAVMKELSGIDGFFTSKIVYVSGSGQKRDLYIMDYDGYNAKRLTSHSSIILSPDCSSDGTRVVFNSDKVWSQDIYVLTLAPRVEEKRITRSLKLEQSPEWSPDGRRIAYSANGDIYVANADGNGAVNLTGHPSIDVSPTWSPDGSQIAFVSDRAGSPQIYIMSSNGGNPRKITSGGYNTDPAWSSNISVNRISFVRVEGSEANIYTVNPDGSDLQKLTGGSRRNENPSWSPDGHYIAFSSTRTGAKNIYIMYLNGENQRPLTKDSGKSFPTWCR
ncbi:MAG TPA: Tol-Pal system beta propeller repeat protein TolB [Thermodesulfobacteriota bacterium]